MDLRQAPLRRSRARCCGCWSRRWSARLLGARHRVRIVVWGLGAIALLLAVLATRNLGGALLAAALLAATLGAATTRRLTTVRADAVGAGRRRAGVHPGRGARHGPRRVRGRRARAHEHRLQDGLPGVDPPRGLRRRRAGGRGASGCRAASRATAGALVAALLDRLVARPTPSPPPTRPRAPSRTTRAWTAASGSTRSAPGDVAAIDWIREETPDDAVVLEAVGDDYSPVRQRAHLGLHRPSDAARLAGPRGPVEPRRRQPRRADVADALHERRTRRPSSRCSRSTASTTPSSARSSAPPTATRGARRARPRGLRRRGTTFSRC